MIDLLYVNILAGLFDFGKKKDDIFDTLTDRRTEETYQENIDRKDNTDDGRQEDTEVDVDESDYIYADDLNFDDYDDIVGDIEYLGWSRIYSNPYPITINNIDIVSPKLVSADSSGVILELICPPGRIIAICGVEESNIDTENFYNTPNLYSVPHFFTLRCTDSNGIELSPTAIISMSKVARDDIKNNWPDIYYQEFYGDLSPIIDGKLKKKEERYYFAKTIILQSGEKLIFRVHNTNIDISNIDLLMLSDLFKKDE